MAASTRRRESELATLRQMMSAGPKLTDATPQERRQAWETASRYLPAPTDVEFDHQSIGGVPATSVRSSDSGNGTILYVHGGSHTAGSLTTHRNILGDLARATSCEVIAPWFRLAPEHAFPAALDDVGLVYEECSRKADRAFFVVGDSSGGGLAVSMLMTARDAGRTMPKALVCLSPWLDLTLTAPSLDKSGSTDFVLDRQSLATSAEAYLDGHIAGDPYVSPALGDWSGLPPTLIQAGGAELLLDDAIAGARAAIAAGVRVTLEIWPGMPHGYHLLGHALSDGRIAMTRAMDWMLATGAET